MSHVIYFDGVCGLCNGFVDFIMRIDQKNLFSFAPLQGDYAAQHLSSEDTKNLSSVVVVSQGKVLRKSQAVLEVFRILGFPWTLFHIARVLPDSALDVLYDWVARNRYAWFGKKETCRLPTPEERSRFRT